MRILKSEHFKYLGSEITQDACCFKIKKRIALARKNLSKMRTLLTNSHIVVNTRKRLVETFKWSVLLYGCESQTMNKEMQRKLEAMAMWCWRRMLKIPWTARKTKDEVLERMDTRRGLMKKIRK